MPRWLRVSSSDRFDSCRHGLRAAVHALKGCWLADDHVLFTEPTNVRTGKQRKAS